jgi:hypothetical protein
MRILYAVKIPGARPAAPEELLHREISHLLKKSEPLAVELAARFMAALIDGPCWLVPVPASSCSLAANTALAKAIAALVEGARLKYVIARREPIASTCVRRAQGLPLPTVEEHGMIRTGPPFEVWPLYFVDNCVTTGTTLEACRTALGYGDGLVFGDASTARNQRRRRPLRIR